MSFVALSFVTKPHPDERLAGLVYEFRKREEEPAPRASLEVPAEARLERLEASHSQQEGDPEEEASVEVRPEDDDERRGDRLPRRDV